jgi:hypothetical protein
VSREMIIDYRHYFKGDPMRRLTAKENKRIEKAMRGLDLDTWFLFASTMTGGETLFHLPKDADVEMLEALLGGFCARHEELMHFFMGVLRRAVGASRVEVLVEDDTSRRSTTGRDSTTKPKELMS